MSRFDVMATLTDRDAALGSIRASTRPSVPVSLSLGLDLRVYIDSAAPDPLAIADAVLTAVTQWRDEIHRRGHAGPVVGQDESPAGSG